ncbi:MAG TPA: DUF58 domain-containing protein [Coriobacteriia bacterium]
MTPLRLPRVRLFVAPKAAALLAAGALPAVLLPGWWAYAVAWSWAWVVFWLVVYDRSQAVRPGELELTREMPAKFSIGVPNPVTLVIANPSGRRAHLTVRETPPAAFAGTRSLGRLSVPRRDSLEAPMSFTPPARGLFRFGDVGVRSLGPRGLAGHQFAAPSAEEARVYPDIQAVNRYALLARKGTLYEIGVKAARYAGAGTEFESLRDYLPGDDYRDIDWKATARRGKPITRRFEAERSQTMVLAIDAGRLMTPRVSGLTKLDRAVNAALLLAYLGTQADDHVGLLVFGRDVQRYLPPRKGHRQFLAIMEALYSVEGRLEEPDYAGALRYLAARLTKRSLIVLFTDLVGTEPSRRLLGVLATLAPRHLPLVVTQRNRQVEARAEAVPTTESDVFEAAVAEDVLRDKAAALRMLRSRGALVLDVDPQQLSVAAVNRFLEVKARGQL